MLSVTLVHSGSHTGQTLLHSDIRFSFPCSKINAGRSKALRGQCGLAVLYGVTKFAPVISVTGV